MDELTADYGNAMTMKLPMMPGGARLMEYASSVELTDLIDITATRRALIKLRWRTNGDECKAITCIIARTEGKLSNTVITYIMIPLMRAALTTMIPSGTHTISACRGTPTQGTGIIITAIMHTATGPGRRRISNDYSVYKATIYLPALTRGGTTTDVSSTRATRNDLGTRDTSTTCTAVIDLMMTITSIANITAIGMKLITMERMGRDSAGKLYAKATVLTMSMASRRRKRK